MSEEKKEEKSNDSKMRDPERLEMIKVIAGLLASVAALLSAIGVFFSHLGPATQPTLPTIPQSTPSTAQPPDKFAQVPNVPSGLFNYGGSTTWAPIRGDVDSVIENVWPQFKLRYTQPAAGPVGSSTGVKMLLDNQLAFLQSSRSLKDEEYQTAKQKGFTLKETAIAIDAIAFIVNPNLNIPGLTIAQIKGIYTGKITNWNQVGGPNQKIIPYSRHRGASGTIDFFIENILENENLGDQVQFVDTTTEAVKKVATNPGSIYYASAATVVPQCTVKSLPVGRQSDAMIAPYQEPLIILSQCPSQQSKINPAANKINTAAFENGKYPITRRLFVIIKQDGQIDQQAGEAYANLLLTDQGQKLIQEAGFIRIR